jgi:hypothetical protein
MKQAQLQDILCLDMHTDLSHIYLAIDELQELCWLDSESETEDVDKHINSELIADIKDIFKKRH